MIRTMLVFALLVSTLSAQERVTPQQSKGGQKQGELWADVPESYRNLKIPAWPVPTDLKQWEQSDRERTRATLRRCLGEMPPRPDPAQVKVLSKEEQDDFTVERFEFHNGVDSKVPGMILVPKHRKGPAPAVIGLHGHGSTKERVLLDRKSAELIGPMLAKRGYVVAAIDSAFCGERVGKGPAGTLDKGRSQEESLFKLYLLQGRSLWGMMLREEQCLIDYLQSRPEVDPGRIAATGMSMGCTRSWWLGAIDDRIQAVVGVACFTRYTELIALGNLRYHGIYYFVPGVFSHFDTEAIHSLIAPRPHLELSGDQDGGAPTEGILTLEKKLGAVYGLYGNPDHFRSVIYKNTAHEYLPEMKEELVRWLDRHLPVVPQEDLLKSATFYASFDAAVKADFGGGELTLSTRTNHKTEKGVYVYEKGFSEKSFRIAESKGIAGGALEAVDTLPDNGRIFFPAKGNVPYRKGGWSGSMSMWLSLDPDTQLKTKSCDPVQINQRSAGNGSLWIDFNDAKPNRNLRLGAFPVVTETRPMIKESREAWSPLIWVDAPGFRAGEWHHVVMNWWNFDTGRNDGRAAFYIDGKLMGLLKDLEYPLTMEWDLEKTGIYLAINLIGRMDEFAVFNRPLTPEEISLLREKPATLASLKTR
jgi:hypothetical protein